MPTRGVAVVEAEKISRSPRVRSGSLALNAFFLLSPAFLPWEVVMIERGMQLAAEARAELRMLEAEISDWIGADAMEALRVGLEKGWETRSSPTGKMAR